MISAFWTPHTQHYHNIPPTIIEMLLLLAQKKHMISIFPQTPDRTESEREKHIESEQKDEKNATAIWKPKAFSQNDKHMKYFRMTVREREKMFSWGGVWGWWLGVDEELHYVSDRHVYVLFVFVSSLVESHSEKKAKFECEEFALSSHYVPFRFIYNPLNQPFNSSIHTKSIISLFLLLPFLSVKWLFP